MRLPLMISCRRASELTEKKLAGELTWTANIQLLLHRAMCDACRRYGLQSEEIDLLLRHQKKETPPPAAADDSADHSLENKILDRLKDL